MNVPVLLYHSVSAESDPRFRRWVIAPERFEEHMAVLAADGYRSHTVSEYAAWIRGERNLSDRPVVVTFDDGFADFRTAALPIMRRYGVTSTMYLSTGYLGGTSTWLAPEGEAERRMLSWSDVFDMADEDLEIGAHGRTHRQMDTLALEEAVADIAQSKWAIEARLGTPIRTMAYPHGYSTRALREEVAAMGFTSACGVKHALSSEGDDLYSLARVIVGGEVDTAEFRRLLAGDGLRVSPPTSTLRGWGWRCYRKLTCSGAEADPVGALR